MTYQQFAKDVVVDGVRGRNESLLLGFLAGLIAAVVGALAWMWITLVTGIHGGFVAIGVGALVGLAVRICGNGTGMIFGIIGGLLTLAGCLGGEILTMAQLSVTPDRDFYLTLINSDVTQMIAIIFDKMDAIMYLIYAIGIFEGYKFSRRN